MDNRETKSHGSLSFPAELYHVDKSHIRYRMSCHWHPEHELIRVISGTLRVSLNELTFVLCAGDFVFVPGGTLLRGEPNECVYKCIVFDPVGLCGEKERKPLSEAFPSFHVHPLHHGHNPSDSP